MDNVYGSFGCHPHWVKEFDEEAREFLKVALGHKKVVAAGEFGLDYSGWAVFIHVVSALVTLISKTEAYFLLNFDISRFQ